LYCQLLHYWLLITIFFCPLYCQLLLSNNPITDNTTAKRKG
jgi:hypothetical protein